MQKHHTKKVNRSFNPDEISTSVSSAVTRDLARRTFLFDYRDDHGARHFGADTLARDVLKRYVPTNVDRVEQEMDCYKAFSAINDHMKLVSARFEGYKPVPSDYTTSNTSYLFDRVMTSARHLVKQILGDAPSCDEYLLHVKHGPGATVGIPAKECSITGKFKAPISSSGCAIQAWRRLLRLDNRLVDAIEELNGLPFEDVIEPVPGSRATTVPKSATKRRMIAIEPTVNMYCQQGLMSIMYARLKSFGLDVESLPEKHRRLAYEGSLDNSLATIDFSSASDSVSFGLVKWILPLDWFNLLNEVRSPTISILEKDVPLHMFSTMGNGTTFPLETLIFYALAVASHWHNTKRDALDDLPSYEAQRACSVFGDDCILPTESAGLFKAVATEAGFLVNDDKSFTGNEHFRESCGGDFYHGVDVRPYSFRPPHNRRLSSLEPWLYVIWNSLLKKYITYFGETSYIYDKELFRLMSKLFRQYKLKVKFVPDDYPDDAGLKLSEDSMRLRACYDIPVSPVYCDDHGTYTFKYCSFRYKMKQPYLDAFRYAITLKNRARIGEDSMDAETGRVPGFNPLRGLVSKSTEFVSDKRIGGYVVVRGYSCNLTIS